MNTLGIISVTAWVLVGLLISSFSVYKQIVQDNSENIHLNPIYYILMIILGGVVGPFSGIIFYFF